MAVDSPPVPEVSVAAPTGADTTPGPVRPTADGTPVATPGTSDSRIRRSSSRLSLTHQQQVEGAAGAIEETEATETVRVSGLNRKPYQQRFLTPLRDMCVQVIASNFEDRPTFGDLPPRHVKSIVDKLRLDLPLELVGRVVADEGYWKRRSAARWHNLDVVSHGGSWKQLYFERNLQAVLETYDPSKTDVSDLKRLLAFSRRYVRNLTVRQLPSHMDLNVLFDSMGSHLTGLDLTYSMRNVGMDYDKSLFGMKLSDCQSLAAALKRCETLTHLTLSSNLIDDDRCRMLASGLVDNASVTHLDLSHNRIADRGARALAKLLDHHSVIFYLDLCDNSIHTEGGRALARALKTNTSLLSLNMRLNRVGDDGGRAMCDALVHNTSLERYNVSANALGTASASAVSDMLRANITLKEVDLSCNLIGVDGGRLIHEALEENTTLMTLDLRGCQVGADTELAVLEHGRAMQEGGKMKPGRTVHATSSKVQAAGGA